MLNYLGLTSQHPMGLMIKDIIYYSLICFAVIFSLFLANKRLISIGYSKIKVMIFTLLCVAVILPAAYIGTRAAAMFYKPLEQWSTDLLFETILSGKGHTYHGGFIISFLFVSLVIILVRFKYFETIDTMALYLPVGHAIGRVACLMVGCCWGRNISFKLNDFQIGFQNPVPLYEIALNSIIFLFLRRIYESIYSNTETRARHSGSVLALYLMLYGVGRIILEIFRKERKILFNLTQAQVVMIMSMIIGLALFLIIKYVRGRLQSEGHAETAAGIELNRLFSFAGFVISCMFLFFIFYHLSIGVHILPWPLQKAKTVTDSYAHILYYLPMMIVPAISLIWLKKLNLPILENFKWNQISMVFFISLAISIFYSVELLVIQGPRLQGIVFWPPIIVVCVMNAFSEEILYRLSFFSMFKWAGYSSLVSNISQSLLYSLLHFMMAGPLLGILSIMYGYILGITMERNRSLTPCIICHFLIDIGCIGLPVLLY